MIQFCVSQTTYDVHHFVVRTVVSLSGSAIAEGPMLSSFGEFDGIAGLSALPDAAPEFSLWLAFSDFFSVQGAAPACNKEHCLSCPASNNWDVAVDLCVEFKMNTKDCCVCTVTWRNEVMSPSQHA